MGHVGARRDGRAGKMSTAEAFRIYREVKKFQEEAGITPPDPRDKDAIRRGFFGDAYGKSPIGIEESMRSRPRR